MSKKWSTFYKRYAYSLNEIEAELVQIKENYEFLHEESKITVSSESYPKAVKYDGKEKEFLVKIYIEPMF